MSLTAQQEVVPFDVDKEKKSKATFRLHMWIKGWRHGVGMAGPLGDVDETARDALKALLERYHEDIREGKNETGTPDEKFGLNAEQEQLRERLAAYAHEAWSGWMKYLFQKGNFSWPAGTFTVDRTSVERWRRQIRTPYDELSEKEKESDRQEADRMLALINQDG